MTHNGEAVESATISFIPEQGPAANGDVDSGSYTFTEEDGPVPGRQKVILESMVTEKFKRSGGRWEFEIELPRQGPFTQHFELNDAKQKNP